MAEATTPKVDWPISQMQDWVLAHVAGIADARLRQLAVERVRQIDKARWLAHTGQIGHDDIVLCTVGGLYISVWWEPDRDAWGMWATTPDGAKRQKLSPQRCVSAGVEIVPVYGVAI